MSGEGLDDLRADHLGEEVRREAEWRRTIADLQTKLQQALETLSHVNEAYDSVKAERDAAIEDAAKQRALAEGTRRLRRFVDAVEQCDWLTLVDIAGLANTSRGLLALYQEESLERGPARTALLTDAARIVLAPAEAQEEGH